MTKNELIKLLNEIDGDPKIVLSSDAEGNSYRYLVDYEISSYDESCKEVGLLELTEELRSYGYTEEDVLDGERVIVLYPC